jgi:hypothetical protein
MAPRIARRAPAPGASAGAVIPYDYAAAFELTGRPGNLVQDVINISTEGVFVAVAIGYGFEEDRGRDLIVSDLGPTPGAVPTVVDPSNITLGQIPVGALIEGFRVNPDPRFEPMVFRTDQTTGGGPRGTLRGEKEFSNHAFPAEVVSNNLFQQVKSPEEISFLFSIVDSGSGRELQDEPTHNLASLGKSNGERPFRLLAQPVTFLPRSTIRLQIVERSEGVRGTLFIVLYGYKLLGAAGCPEPLVRSLRGSPTCPIETIGNPSARVIPFDYVATLRLTGRPGNLVEDEVSINVEGGFIATALGYGLAVEERDVSIPGDAAVREAPGIPRDTINLSNVPLRLLPPSALSDGIRIRPNFLRIAFENNGRLATALPVNLANKLFERLNRPEDVSFRYEIFDSGTGREIQNRAINNIAGLGIANGDRPFKKFARPMIFLPRSTIRVKAEERFGRGTLFLVFQGYKLLGAPLTGGRR